ncbi:unnamed protein product [Mytilus edulis]|uniref:Uncharacterized protein n=1 Tax=Mytilus edulis TaxID=6550 RepID=A0A8S3S9J1_MYTED|nr:unnamed protein product [Mytilus edulis]
MYTNNKICFLHLAILTIFDGRLSKHRFEDDDDDEIIWEALNFLREECNLNSVQYENILQGTLSLVGRYVTDNVSDYVIIHPELVDLLEVYFFNKMPKSMLTYGSDHFLQMKIQLASIVTPLIPGIIMIDQCLEDVYFSRIIHDIENKQYKNAFDNIQIANELYQDKLITYLSKSPEVLELVLSDFKTLLFSVENGASNLVNFIIVECRNRDFMSEYSRFVFHSIYDKRVTLKLYPHVEEESLLLLASLKGHISVIKVLLSLGFDKDHQDEFHSTPLHMACIQGHSDVVRLLLQCGCDIHLCHGLGGTALHEACLSGSTETVEIFMQILKSETEDSLKPDYSMRDFNNKTPLFLACSGGHLGIVKLFATLVNTTSSPIPNPFDFTVTNQNEWNMLHVTCQYGHTGIVTILLEQNFAVNETDTDGWTPLFHACDYGRTEIIKLLLKKDLNVNIQDNKGLTSLHVACKHCHPEIVMLLVECQCNRTLKIVLVNHLCI